MTRRGNGVTSRQFIEKNGLRVDGRLGWSELYGRDHWKFRPVPFVYTLSTTENPDGIEVLLFHPESIAEPHGVELVMSCLQTDAKVASFTFESWREHHETLKDSPVPFREEWRETHDYCRVHTHRLREFLGDAFGDFMATDWETGRERKKSGR